MYEENCKPLPHGDASVVFAEQLAEMQRHGLMSGAADITPDNVVRWADPTNQPHFAAICRRLLLPGSGLAGVEHLRQSVQRAQRGNACLLCLNHRSNLDVPTLQALLQDDSDADLFDQIIWIAGRKLEEDVGMTSLLLRCFNRVIVTPHSWFASPHSDDEIHAAHRLNFAAERAISRLRHQGWVFGLFPAGTRIRPSDDTTKQAIAQTDSYLRMFDYLLLCNIDGCTLPVSKNRDLTHETPRLDRMRYTFGPVQRTKDWREIAAARFPNHDQRLATVRAIREDIERLGSEA